MHTKIFCSLFAFNLVFFALVARAGEETEAANQLPVVTGPEIWKDPTQPLDARVHDLVSRMSLAEKVSQMDCVTPAIPRLGVPAYSYRNECLHGRRAANLVDFNTVFPQAIGMAATWDVPLIHDEADAISTEFRAAHNDYVNKHNGDSTNSFGLTCYTPNINIFRDPRWGRGQETYGEDPFLTAQTAVAFIDGLQGDDPRYIKIMACAKHFAVHSGPEPDRHRLNATPPERDLYETYLPAFEAAVREGHVGSVMGSYSSLDGVPDCANHFLLTDLLRTQWGFDGFVVSDGSAIVYIWKSHKYVGTLAEAAAAAVKAGCDLSSGAGKNGYGELPRAIQKGLISEDAIDAAVSRDLASRFQVGLFDPPSMVPWSKITLADNDTPAHRALALKVAEESIVLLKNNPAPAGLPLNRAKIKHIAVIGPNADSVTAVLGSYNGNPSQTVTILDGIKAVAGTNIEVTYTPGCPLALKNDDSNQPASDMTAQAIAAVKLADVVIYVGGIDSTLENEENHNSRKDYQGFDRGDRTRIELPSPQEDLLKALSATGKPVIFVNCSGSAIAMPWAAEHLPAIIQAWYPGEQGGRAVAEVLFGDVDPGGRLPVTFYASTADLPAFGDYSMSNRTYRYFNGKPLFAFGHGLSYTKFSYKKTRLDQSTVTAGDTVKVSFELKNSGMRAGDEVAQVYFRHVKSSVPQAKLALCGFTRIHLARGESKTVTLDIPSERFRYWDTAKGQYVVEPGKYQLLIGGASDDIQLNEPFKIVGMTGTGAGVTAVQHDAVLGGEIVR
jgi:beta-glucosidase